MIPEGAAGGGVDGSGVDGSLLPLQLAPLLNKPAASAAETILDIILKVKRS